MSDQRDAQTPSRKRGYRKAMPEGPMDRSMDELEKLLVLELSPSTKKAIEIFKKDWHDFLSMSKDDEGYSRKQEELIRSESYTQKLLAKDAKYASVAAEYAKLVKQKRMVDLGDFHRGNLYHLKLAAKEMVEERNTRKKQELKRKMEAVRKRAEAAEEEKNEQQDIEKEPNLLDGRPWKDVLKELDEEEELCIEWRRTWAAMAKDGQKVPEPPKTPMSKFISDTAARSPRSYTLAQARFEIQQYKARNEIAHIGVDEAISEAKNANSGESDHWRHLAQIILKERKAIQEGDIPESLRGREAQIAETLSIYQANYFQTITTEVDIVNDVWKPDEVIVAERYLPRAEPEGLQYPDLKQRALGFKPSNTWEKSVKEDYLAAIKEEEHAQAELKEAEAAYSEASKRKSEARKECGKAHQKLKMAGASYLAMENYIKKENR
jgi:hypothetical protein